MTRVAMVALCSSMAVAGPTGAAGEAPLSCPSGSQRIVNDQERGLKEELCAIPAPVPQWKWRRVGPYRKHKQGEKRVEGGYVDGSMDGVWREWSEAGQLLSEGGWKAGVRDGPLKIWYPNGKPAEESHWRAGVRIGLARAWYETGVLREEAKLDDSGRELEWAAYAPDGRRRTAGPCVDDGDCALIPNPVCNARGTNAWAPVSMVDKHQNNVPQPPTNCPPPPQPALGMPNYGGKAVCKAGKCAVELETRPSAY